MKKLILTLGVLILLTLSAKTQVAINTDGASPDNSAMLDVKATDKGFLVPRMTQAQKTSVSNPATGLIIYQTDGSTGLYYNAGTAAVPDWIKVGSGSGQWTSNGSNLYYSAGNVGIGTNAPSALLEVNGDAKFNGHTIGRGGGNILNNTAIGSHALYDNETGSNNIAIGNAALRLNKAGSRSVAIGANALYKSNNLLTPYNADNIAIGYCSMLGPSYIGGNITGIQNTAVGSESLERISSGSSNVAVGYTAGYNTSSGFQNTAVGASSLTQNVNGSYNTAIGYNTGPNTSNLSNTTTLGIDASATATDQVRIGNVFVNSIGGYVNWSNISDGRFKENLSENVPGLSFITQLRPVTYRLNRNAINAYIGVDAAYKGEAMSGITSGFVAQEVEMAAQQLGYDFSGVDAPKNEKDVYALRYSDFVVPLVKAVQEQQQQITDLKNDNTELKSVIEELRAINLAIEQRLKALESNPAK
ncbi:MAG: tail fiber domain-containing protein [Bacteroidales bacterium]|nr:tail fiber domain-containing protein [Bacteroidales bacterium]